MNVFTMRTRALGRTLLALLSLVLAGTALAGDDSDNDAILPALKTITTLSPTVPANGDQNPYGVAQVKRTTGNLRAGHILVSNFNDKGNFQGAGTTIVDIAPDGSMSLFADLDAKKLPGSCPGGGMGLAARMLGFRTDYPNLTDAQQAEINDILAKEKPTVEPLIRQLALGHQEIEQLEQASSFDETKARTLATQQSQTMAELMVEKARIKSELMQVLTTEQKAKMAQFQARQQARLQKRLEQVQTGPTETAPN